MFKQTAPANYNIAPTQEIATVAIRKDGARKIVPMARVGPAMIEGIKAAFTTSNAKAEPIDFDDLPYLISAFLASPHVTAASRSYIFSGDN